jgi:micrococcal nuclease
MNKLNITIILLILALIFLLTFYSCSGQLHYAQQGKLSVPFGKSYNYADIFVIRVIDGDTLQLANGERVRLIGIDTPEIHESDKLYRDSQRTKRDVNTIRQMGRRAYEFTKNLVEGKRVRLEFDVDKRDRYNRLLAYVYLKEDNTFVNAKIIEEGYASLMTIPPNVKQAQLFLQLNQEARRERRGLWQ